MKTNNVVTLSEIAKTLKMDPKNARARMRTLSDTVVPWLVGDKTTWTFPAKKRSAVEALLKRGRK